MSGWKSILGGVLAVCFGTAGLIWGFVNDQLAISFVMAGFVSLGVMGIGIAHKIEKSGTKKK